jgi:hypothetical protein
MHTICTQTGRDLSACLYLCVSLSLGGVVLSKFLQISFLKFIRTEVIFKPLMLNDFRILPAVNG